MKASWVLWAIAAVVILGGGGVVVTGYTQRGYRNNNPGNLRWDGRTQWQGMTGHDADGFIIFSSMEYGFRAMARVIVNYQKRGLTTVRQIITTWAPPSENDTAAYVNAVADQLGVGPDEHISVGYYMPDLLAAIAKHENGWLIPTASASIEQGIALA